MKKIKKNALWIAMAILGFVIVILWPMEKLGHGGIIFITCWVVIVIALVIIGQVNLSQTCSKLDAVPMELIKPFNKLHEKEQNDAFWFVTRLLSLSQELEANLYFFNIANAVFEKDKREGKNTTLSETEKKNACMKLNATNDKFEALRSKIL